MNSSHEHGRWRGGPPATRGARLALSAVLVPVGLAVLAGLVLLWPHPGTRAAPSGDTAYAVAGATFPEGTVVSISHACPPAAVKDGSCAETARVRVTGARTVSVQLTPSVLRSDLTAGEEIKLVHLPPADGAPETWVFLDYVRDTPLAVLAVMFAAVVIGVARLRGATALLGLATAFGVLVAFVLPTLMAGEPALPVALTGAGAIVFVVLYLAHGPSARTSTALLGTLFGLAATAVLAWWATGAAHLNGLGSEDNATLVSLAPDVQLTGLILCGIVIAGLGILNDVTVTQASAVWELHASAPTMPATLLFTRAMRIGRDHIASTVYTIAFAYAGTALPVLLLIDLYRRPLAEVLTGADLAEEIGRTLIGSIGLVLAIPATTAVAVAVVRAGARTGRPHPTPVPRPADHWS